MSSNYSPLVSVTVPAAESPAVQTSASEPGPSKLDQGLITASHLLDVSLGSLQILAAGIHDPKLGAAAGIAAEVVPLIESAIAKLLEVKGSATTYGQLEKLRFTPKW